MTEPKETTATTLTEEQKRPFRVTSDVGVILNVSALNAVNFYTDSLAEDQCVALMVATREKVFLGHVYNDGGTMGLKKCAERYLSQILNLLGRSEPVTIYIVANSTVRADPDYHPLLKAFRTACTEHGIVPTTEYGDMCCINMDALGHVVLHLAVPVNRVGTIDLGEFNSPEVNRHIAGIIRGNDYFGREHRFEIASHNSSEDVLSSVPRVRRLPSGWDSESLVNSEEFKRLSGPMCLGSEDLRDEVLNEICEQTSGVELTDTDKISICDGIGRAMESYRQERLSIYNSEAIASRTMLLWREAKQQQQSARPPQMEEQSHRVVEEPRQPVSRKHAYSTGVDGGSKTRRLEQSPSVATSTTPNRVRTLVTNWRKKSKSPSITVIEEKKPDKELSRISRLMMGGGGGE